MGFLADSLEKGLGAEGGALAVEIYPGAVSVVAWIACGSALERRFGQAIY